MRSIVLQLSGQSSTAWQILIDSTEYFEGIWQNIETTWTVSVSFLLKILDRYLLAYNKIYLVLDALDESIDQEIALDFIMDLLARKPGRVNILISSRQERNIQQVLENSATVIVAVTAETVDYDIRLHIQKRLSHDQRLQRWPETLRSDIEVSLIKGSLGMSVTPRSIESKWLFLTVLKVQMGGLSARQNSKVPEAKRG